MVNDPLIPTLPIQQMPSLATGEPSEPAPAIQSQTAPIAQPEPQSNTVLGVDPGDPAAAQMAFEVTKDRDPSREGMLVDLAAKSGMPINALRTFDPDELKAIADDPAQYLEAGSKTTKFLSDPQNAAVAQGQERALWAMEKAFEPPKFSEHPLDYLFHYSPMGYAARNIGVPLAVNLAPTVNRGIDQAKRALLRGGVSASEVANDPTGGLKQALEAPDTSIMDDHGVNALALSHLVFGPFQPNGMDPAKADLLKTQQTAQAERAAISEATGWNQSIVAGAVSEGAKFAAFGLGAAPRVLGASAIGTMIAGPEAGALGGAAAFTQDLFEQSVGGLALQLSQQQPGEEPIPPKMLALGALIGGSLNTAWMVGGMGAIAKIAGKTAAGKAIIEKLTGAGSAATIRQALLNPDVQAKLLPLVQEATIANLKGAGVAGIVMAGAEIINQATGSAVKGKNEFDLHRALVSAGAGFAGGLTLGLPMSVFGVAMETTRQVEDAQLWRDKFVNLHDQVHVGEGAELKARSVTTMGKFLQDLGGDVYLDGEDAWTLNQTSPDTLAKLGLTPEVINTAKAFGNAVKIPMRDAIMELDKGEFEKIADIAKPSPMALSSADADKYNTPEGQKHIISILEQAAASAEPLKAEIDRLGEQLRADPLKRFGEDTIQHFLSSVEGAAYRWGVRGVPLEHLPSKIREFKMSGESAPAKGEGLAQTWENQPIGDLLRELKQEGPPSEMAHDPVYNESDYLNGPPVSGLHKPWRPGAKPRKEKPDTGEKLFETIARKGGAEAAEQKADIQARFQDPAATPQTKKRLTEQLDRITEIEKEIDPQRGIRDTLWAIANDPAKTPAEQEAAIRALRKTFTLERIKNQTEEQQKIISDPNAKQDQLTAAWAKITELNRERMALEAPVSNLAEVVSRFEQSQKSGDVTENPAFRAWFGDSKVVDEATGKPLVVYHGTNQSFDTFDPARIGTKTDSGLIGKGFYFHEDPGTSEVYGKNVMPVYLKADKIFDFNETGKTINQVMAEHGGKAGFAEWLKANGYDGARVWKQIMVLDPTQIKSATANRGTFDPTKPSILEQFAAPIDKLGFFSPLHLHLLEGNWKQMPASDLVKQLSGAQEKGKFRKEELDDIGLHEWLGMMGEKKVSKDQVLQFIQDGGPGIKEITLQDKPLTDLKWSDSYDDGNGQTVWGTNVGRRGFSITQYKPDGFLLETGAGQRSVHESFAEANRVALEMANNTKTPDTKYHQYATPGGENYREILLTLPEKSTRKADVADLAELNAFKNEMLDKYGDNWQQKATAEEMQRNSDLARKATRSYSEHRAQSFSSPHFDGRDNILAHARVSDFVDADGKRVLHIDEIQSDWHQEGREKGYTSKYKPEELVINRKDSDMRDGRFWIIDAPGQSFQIPRTKAATPEKAVEYIVASKAKTPGVPDAPFKKSWPMLAFKRMLRLAAEEGYDRVSWTTGEQQAERYDLSKQIDALNYEKKPDGKVFISADKDDNSVISGIYPKEELPGMIGKELAQKIEDDAEPGYKTLSGLDLKIGGEGMKGFYDKILPAEVNKYAKKYGVKVGAISLSTGSTITPKLAESTPRGEVWVLVDENGKSVGNGIDNLYGSAEEAKQAIPPLLDKVHSVDITPEMRKDILEKGQPLYQENGVVKGNTEILPEGYVINIFKEGDLSTILHEFSHVYLLELQQWMVKGGGTKEMAKDWATLTKWLGTDLTKDNSDVKAHEKFARGMEKYFREGVAPSENLQPAFAHFASYLTQIYKRAKDVDAAAGQEIKLDPSVRRVFDRLYALDEEIEASASRNNLAFTEEEFAKMGASQEDKDYLRKLLDNAKTAGKDALQKRRDKAIKGKTKAWGIEAAFTAEEERVYQTEKKLRAEPLDRAMMEAEMGKTITDALKAKYPRLVKKGTGNPAAMAAAEHGYESHSEMINELLNSPKKEEWIQNFIDQKRAEAESQYSADEAYMGTEEAQTYLDTVANHIAKKISPNRVVRIQDKLIHSRAIKAVAEKQLAGMPVNEALRVDIHLSNFKMAMRKTKDSVATGDRVDPKTGQAGWQKALEYNAQARLHYELVRQSRVLATGFEKSRRRSMKALHSKSIEPDFQVALTNTMNVFGMTAKKAEMRTGGMDLKKLLTPETTDDAFTWDAPPAFPETLLDPKPRKWKNLTVSEAQDLFDMLTWLEKTGRNVKEGKLFELKGQQAETATRLTQDMAGLPDYKIKAENTIGRAVQKFFSGYGADMSLLQFILRDADGYRRDGENTTTLFHPLIARTGDKLRHERELMKEMEKPVAALMKSGKDFDPGKVGVPVPQNMVTAGMNWTWARVCGIFLHQGSEYNREAVREGYGLTQDQVNTIIRQLSVNDADHLQKFWDVIQSLWSELKKTHEDVNAIVPRKVSADPFNFITKDGVNKLMRGGYFPLKADKNLDLKAGEWSEKEDIMNSISAAFPKPSVPAGSMISRKGFAGLPPILDFRSVLTRHFDFATTYIHMARILKDVDAVTRNRIYSGAFIQKFGVDRYRQIRPYLASVAAKKIMPMDGLDKMATWANSRGAASVLSGKIGVAAKQAFDIFYGISETDFSTVANGAMAIARDPAGMYQFINEVCPYMEQRSRAGHKEAFEAIKDFGDQSFYGLKREQAADLLMLGFHVGDFAAAYPLWMGKYLDHMQKFGDHDKSVSFATDAVMATQPGYGPLETTSIVRNANAVKKMFLMFSGWTLKFGNMIMSQTNGLMAGKIPPLQVARFIVLAVMAPPILQNITWKIIRNAGSSQSVLPNADDAKNMAVDVVNSFSSGFPVLGSLAQAGTQWMTGRTYGSAFETPALKVANSMAGTVRALSEMVFNLSDPDMMKKSMWTIAEAASLQLRIPATRIYTEWGNGIKQAEETGAPGRLFLPLSASQYQKE